MGPFVHLALDHDVPAFSVNQAVTDSQSENSIGRDLNGRLFSETTASVRGSASPPVSEMILNLDMSPVNTRLLPQQKFAPSHNPSYVS